MGSAAGIGPRRCAAGCGTSLAGRVANARYCQRCAAAREHFGVAQLRPAANPIMAASVVDMDGRRWTLLPLAWRENAPLCSGVTVYDLAGSAHGVACRERSAWASGETGYCCRCIARLVDFGDGEA